MIYKSPKHLPGKILIKQTQFCIIKSLLSRHWNLLHSTFEATKCNKWLSEKILLNTVPLMWKNTDLNGVYEVLFQIGCVILNFYSLLFSLTLFKMLIEPWKGVCFIEQLPLVGQCGTAKMTGIILPIIRLLPKWK